METRVVQMGLAVLSAERLLVEFHEKAAAILGVVARCRV